MTHAESVASPWQAFHHSSLPSSGARSFSTPNEEDLATLKNLAEAGTITPVIDRTYPLSQGADAMADVDEGHAQGATVITM